MFSPNIDFTINDQILFKFSNVTMRVEYSITYDRFDNIEDVVVDIESLTIDDKDATGMLDLLGFTEDLKDKIWFERGAYLISEVEHGTH